MVIPYLDGRSRSPKESETRCLLVFGGLPKPEVNARIFDSSGAFIAIGDLVYRRWRLLIEDEGRQHAESVRQFARDIERYGEVREDGWSYLQVTQQHLERPKAWVLRVHSMLVRHGYDGPAPIFGARWSSLFAPVKGPRSLTEHRRSA